MKKHYFLLLFWISASCIQAQLTNIPDANFEQALIDLAIDSDGVVNGHLQTSDVTAITTLLVYDRGISNFQGIQDFTSLVALNINDNNNFMMQQFFLDLSSNTQLKELYCSYNFMETLDVSNNPLLEILHCDHNFLSNLDLVNNINLKDLNFSFNYLNIINLSQNNNLEKLYCIYNDLNIIDISNLLSLKYFTIEQNNIFSINLSNNIMLELLNLYSNNIATLDLSQNSLLRSIGFGNNNIVNINLNNNTLLDIVYCANSNLLNTIYLQNGNNILLNGVYDLGISIPTYRNRFSAIGCPNLHCIFVDDVANCNENWLGKDATSTYVSTQAQCEAAQLGTTSVVAVSYKVYPNPTNDTVTIDLGSYQEKVIVTLSNVMGQVVSSKTYAQVEAVNYSITGTTGLYFLNIATTTGEKKIIKVMKK